jgi:hypothetical protein
MLSPTTAWKLRQVTGAGARLIALSHGIGSVLAFVDAVLAFDPPQEPANASTP